MAYSLFINDTNNGFIFGSIPVMVKHFPNLDKSHLEYVFARKKEHLYKDNVYTIFKADLIRGGNSKVK